VSSRQDYTLRPVPPRALALSLAALAVPVTAAFLFPESLAQYRAMLWLLALVPAFLLAYYRGWRGVTVAFGGGMAALALTQTLSFLLGRNVQDWPLLVLVVAAYIGIVLGIGWLTETVRDVSARLREEEARRTLEKALDTMQLGVTITDLDGTITYANPADARQHGYTVTELIGQDAGVYAPSPTRRRLTREQLEALSSWKREGVNARKDGSTFPVHLTSDVVRGVSGDPIGIVTTCEDISDRRQADEALQGAYSDLRKSHTALQSAQLQLIEAEKLESVGRLAAGVAHEVKNPLMTLLTGVKILSQRVQPGDEDLATLLRDMEEAVKRADGVIRGLLDFSAPRELDLKVQDLNVIVQRSVELVKHELDRGQVTVVKELQEGLPELELDRFKMEQVLINVLTNAAHATPPGGRITIRTSCRPMLLVGRYDGGSGEDRLESGDYAVFLEIEDSGTGIPEEKLDKIFDPFFTTKPTGKGTGLGLSVTRQIVEMHGARMHIRNREEGGVRVTIVFELSSGESSDGEEAHTGG
jgi:PAS domain S-box-containing protein